MSIPHDFHAFKIENDNLLSLPGGAVYLMSDAALDIFNCNPKNISEAVQRLKGKYPRPTIEEAYREMESVKSIKARDHRNDNPPRRLRALCLNVTHRCNLACAYCFASELTSSKAPTMDGEVITQSLDLLFRESEEVDYLQVDFFGGEPLLCFDLVKFAVEYARNVETKYKKRVNFTLTTNATLLDDEIIEFLKKNEISLILSLDGRKEVNDLHRRFKDGRGSFDIILQNINKVKELMSPHDYYIRGTFTRNTLDILDTLKFYHQQGFYNVSLEPVSSEEGKPYYISPELLKEILEKYRQAARWLVDKPMKFYHFNLELDNPLCLTRRITGCGAGVEYLAVDPIGDLYPCHQFIGLEQFKMGNVREGVKNNRLRETFKKATLYQKQGCPDCWARFYCGGGCHFDQFVSSGDIFTPSDFYCQLFKGRLEASLWYNVRKKEFGTFSKK